MTFAAVEGEFFTNWYFAALGDELRINSIAPDLQKEVFWKTNIFSIFEEET